MTHDLHSSDATTVPPARPVRAPLSGAPPGRARALSALFWVAVIALVLLSLGADRPEGVVLALIAVGVVALRLRARRAAEPPDEPVTDELPVLPEFAVGLAGRDGSAPPRPVVSVAVLALLQIPVLAGIGWATIVFVDALLSPTGGATPSRVTTIVVALVLAAIPSLVAAVGVWRGSEDARSSLLGLCRVRIGLSALACLLFLTMFTPLVLIVIDHVMQRRLEDPRTVRWCALSREPGPGSPQH